MQINSIQNTKLHPSFQALNCKITSKPGELIFDSVRYALSPEKDELISKIIRRSDEDDINILETLNGRLNLQISSNTENHFSQSSILELCPQKTDTAETFGQRIKLEIDKIYESISELRSGLHFM